LQKAETSVNSMNLEGRRLCPSVFSLYRSGKKSSRINSANS